MKNLVIILTIISVTAPGLRAQKYHTPDQILKILSDSKVMYAINTDDNLQPASIDSLPLNNHGVFWLKNADGTKQLMTYEEVDKSIPRFDSLLRDAEKLFMENKTTDARRVYHTVLGLDAQNSQVMTFIGQTYSSESFDDEAILWYQKAIATNYYDYMAHWFLADAYEKRGEVEKAKKEIITARILNRNNPRLMESLKRIYTTFHSQYSEWNFQPVYSLSKSQEGKVTLTFDHGQPEWLSYALCKALWMYEPGYRESMLKDTRSLPAIVEENECVINLAAGEINAGRKSTNPAVMSLLRAADKKMVPDYVVYEIILFRQPGIVFYFDEPTIDRLVEYVLEIRTDQ